MYQYPPQQYQYSANISPSHYSPPYQQGMPNHPQWPPLNRPQNLLAAHPRPNTTPNTNQNTNQGRNFPEKKLVELTPIPMLYANLLPYLLNGMPRYSPMISTCHIGFVSFGKMEVDESLMGLQLPLPY